MTDIVTNPLDAVPARPGPAHNQEANALADISSQEDTTINSTPAQLRSALEAALKGLKEGNLSEQQATVVLERLVDGRADAAVDRRLKGLATEAGFQTMLRPIIQTACAHLAEAPPNVRLVICVCVIDSMALSPAILRVWFVF